MPDPEAQALRHLGLPQGRASHHAHRCVQCHIAEEAPHVTGYNDDDGNDYDCDCNVDGGDDDHGTRNRRRAAVAVVVAPLLL